MIAVLFEVVVADVGKAKYLDLAATLLPELQKIDGFISVERFQSIPNPGKLLSLSFWQNEDAILQWRRHSRHVHAQQQGRGGIFADYRIRVAGVVRDYGMNERTESPETCAEDAPQPS